MKRYHTGDKLPDSIFLGTTKPLNILMLWNVNCTGCIMEMPYLEQLQQKFARDVQIVMLTKDSKEEMSELIMHAKNVRQLKLPNITGEMLLPSSFEYQQVPTQVWVDSTKTIVYITKGDIADEDHIKAFLRGVRLHIPELKDTLLSSGDNSRPLAVTLNQLQQGRFIISSYLAPHLQSKYWYGMTGQFFSDSLNSIRKVRYTVNDLYRLAYLGGDERNYALVRVISNLTDQNRLLPDPLTWQNYFDYELTIKRPISEKQFFRIMQADLNNSFVLTSRMEKRVIPCYVLKRKIGIKLFADNQKVPEEPQAAYNKLTANKSTLGDAMRIINRLRVDKQVPILNETNLSEDAIITIGTIDLDFEHHFEQVKAAFAKAGIKFTIEKRTINCIILKDNSLLK